MKEQELELLTIPAELLQEIINYLLNHPMKDVMGLVNAIQQNSKPLPKCEDKE